MQETDGSDIIKKKPVEGPAPGGIAVTLDQEFFKSSKLDVVKRKYYEADKVDELLGEIRLRAESTNRENAELRGELEAFRGQKAEIGDMLLSARSLARHIVENANTQADEIVAQAQEKAERIVREAEEKAGTLLESAQQRAEAMAAKYPDQQEQAARCVESAIDRLKQRQQDAIDELSALWQDFLISLSPGEEAEPADPEDLSKKVGAIAQELRALEKKD